MKIFLTGGTGFIGLHLTNELLSRGHEVTVLARNPEKAAESVANVNVVQGDLLNEDLVKGALEGHDVCIHNALIWDDEPTELQMKDSRAAAAVFSAAAQAGVGHMIYTSSVAVHRPFAPNITADLPLLPSDFYGATKAAGEAFLWAFSHQTDMRCNVVRPGPAVGAPTRRGGAFKVDRRLRALVEGVARGETVSVAKGESRQFIGAPDLARLYGELVESPLNRSVFLATAKEPTCWESIVRYAIARTGSGSRVCLSDAVPGFRFDVSAMEQEFGLVFDAQVHVEAAIEYLLHGN